MRIPIKDCYYKGEHPKHSPTVLNPIRKNEISPGPIQLLSGFISESDPVALDKVGKERVPRRESYIGFGV